jgi:hypothetical protein
VKLASQTKLFKLSLCVNQTCYCESNLLLRIKLSFQTKFQTIAKVAAILKMVVMTGIKELRVISNSHDAKVYKPNYRQNDTYSSYAEQT